MQLLQKNYRFPKPLRSVGIRGTDLVLIDAAIQLNLFEDPYRICNRCQNKLGGMSYKPFPNDIPMQILRENAHYVSVPGDNGITFVEK